MNETKINTDALSQQLDKLKNAKDKLSTILDNLKKETNSLKDHWESRTSEAVFTSFDEMYTGYCTQIDNLNRDINFLEKTIKTYIEQESKANVQIDEHIAL